MSDVKRLCEIGARIFNDDSLALVLSPRGVKAGLEDAGDDLFAIFSSIEVEIKVGACGLDLLYILWQCQ